jgi:hypothetical protein
VRRSAVNRRSNRSRVMGMMRIMTISSNQTMM